jgi:hypothetical protein
MPRRYRDYTDFIIYYNKIRTFGAWLSLIRTIFFIFIIIEILIEKKEIYWTNIISLEVIISKNNYHTKYSSLIFN